MISTLLRISRISLRRDRVAQMMVFLLPIMFFTIFASVFGRQSMNSMSRIRIAVVDEDRSVMSIALVEALKSDPSLLVRDSTLTGRAARLAPSALLSRKQAEELVKGGDVPAALVLPKGWGATFPNLSGGGMKADVLADPSDPVAKHLVVGLIQRAAAKMVQGAMGGAPAIAGGSASSGGGASPGGGSTVQEAGMLVATRVTDVLGDRKQGGQMISFYAAGIAVMFLLFSCSAAGGVLLDEQDSGTLERVLNTRVGMNGLLAGKWLHITQLGFMQITVMFLYGMLMFHLDLFGHLPGFIVMTVFTAAAAAGFGLVLATLCRTRQQLGGISTIVILSMSALGGSMFPRFLMSEGMQKIGLVTFNAWALDGYIKVFWREAKLIELLPQVAVLGGLTVVFLGAARLLARRWEAV